MPFKLYPEKKEYLHKIHWLRFIQIGPKNAEIAVLEQLEPKIFFTIQPWWVGFKNPDYESLTDKVFTIFTPGDNMNTKKNFQGH